MLTDVHIQRLAPEVFELRVDRFLYHLDLRQILDLYNSLKQTLSEHDTRGGTQMVPDSEYKQAGTQ